MPERQAALCGSPPAEALPLTCTDSSLTPVQQDAIAVLSSQDIDDIFAYIRFARSVDGVYSRKESGVGLGEGLSAHQLQAIETLSGCADRKLRKWLRGGRIAGGSEPFKSFPRSSSYASGYTQTLDPSTAAGDSQVINSSFTNLVNQSQNQLQNTTGIDTKEHPSYHCTVCEQPRPFKNDSDWKKHEKEHEYTYTCTPDGWREKTPFGTKCVFCGVLEPDEQHAVKHNTAQTCSFTCKRRDAMAKHLNKCHKVLDSAEARTIAKERLCASGRRFWSCGLCVDLFPSLEERLRHIDLEHFRKHQSFEDWDITKVILGLLRQIGVSEAWKAQLSMHHGWEHPAVKWEATNLGDLQSRLEMGASDKQSARALAETAYDVCAMGTSEVLNTSSGGADDHEKSTWRYKTPSTCQFRSASYHPHSTQTPSLETLDWNTLYTPLLSESAAGNRRVADATMYQSLSDHTGSQQFTDPVLFFSTGNDASVGTQQWWNSD